MGDPVGTWVTVERGGEQKLRIHRVCLEVTSGPDRGKREEFARGSVRIGSHAEAMFSLSDPKVSAVHCEIRLDEIGCHLRDLGSTNGTRVGDLGIVEVRLPAQAVISLGDTTIAFSAAGDGEMELGRAGGLGQLVGNSPVMRHLFARIERVAATDATVLITGETGTGKDVVAETIHELSGRAAGPLAVLDCSAIPENLVESEIFGHEKGAFTGATAPRAGAFERANGGTLFLDEIGELPLSLQAKFLRVLERRQVRRVGGADTIAVDVRVIAATNRDLGAEVNAGRFREDLFYRLVVAHLEVPPLRQRKEDIPLLVEHFISQLPAGEGTSFDGDALAMLARHSWPGNVRELRNVVERAVMLDEVPESTAALRRARPVPARDDEGDAPVGAAVDLSVPLRDARQEVVDDFERRYVSALLEQHGYNMSAAARAAGVDRMTLRKIAERVNIPIRRVDR